MTILITGIAGFIGYHLAKELRDKGHHILGVDNLTKSDGHLSTTKKVERLTRLGLTESTGLFMDMDKASTTVHYLHSTKRDTEGVYR